jgi:hypothetical protein
MKFVALVCLSIAFLGVNTTAGLMAAGYTIFALGFWGVHKLYTEKKPVINFVINTEGSIQQRDGFEHDGWSVPPQPKAVKQPWDID